MRSKVHVPVYRHEPDFVLVDELTRFHHGEESMDCYRGRANRCLSERPNGDQIRRFALEQDMGLRFASTQQFQTGFFRHTSRIEGGWQNP